jgi:hypothetical protein
VVQDMRVKLNTGLLWQQQHSTGTDSFYQQIGLKFKGKTSDMLHLDHSIVWC